MGMVQVENREEGLVFGAVLVVRAVRRGVPVRVIVALEIVVGFRPVGAVVTGVTEEFDIGSVGCRDRVAAAHVLGAHGGGVGTDEDCGSRDRADRSVRVSVLKKNALLRKGIQMRSLCLEVSVASEPVGGIVFAGDPEDVGFLGCKSERAEMKQDEYGGE